MIFSLLKSFQLLTIEAATFIRLSFRFPTSFRDLFVFKEIDRGIEVIQLDWTL